jgi:hypothetical protein
MFPRHKRSCEGLLGAEKVSKVVRGVKNVVRSMHPSVLFTNLLT